MSIERKARRDAREYARAQMYYGDGAGIRRKHISATVESRAKLSPTYAQVFHAELARQDMAEHAAKARGERTRKDVGEAVSHNAKALVGGKYESVNGAILIAIVTGYFVHTTGLDQKIYDKGRELHAKVKNKIAVRRILKETNPKNN